MNNKRITTLFLDIGGVVLTNGWGHEARNKAVEYFKLNNEELNERHHLTFDTYEEGKLTLSEYLKRIVFYKQRSFSEIEFTEFMFKQSLLYQDTFDFFKEISSGESHPTIVRFLDASNLIFATPNFVATCVFEEGESSIK